MKELFDVYCQYKVANNIWDAMHKKYALKDVGTHKYVVGNFMKFLIVKTLSLVHKLEILFQFMFSHRSIFR